MGDLIGATINLLNTCTLLMGKVWCSATVGLTFHPPLFNSSTSDAFKMSCRHFSICLTVQKNTHTHIQMHKSTYPLICFLSAHTCSHSHSITLLCWKVIKHTVRHAPCFFIFTTHTPLTLFILSSAELMVAPLSFMVPWCHFSPLLIHRSVNGSCCMSSVMSWALSSRSQCPHRWVGLLCSVCSFGKQF